MIRAVSFDAMGTLVYLDEPAGRLTRALADRGHAVSGAAAASALRAEIDYFRAHMHRGVDASSRDALERDCVGVLAAALPIPIGEPAAAEALREALAYECLPGASDAIARAAAAGLRIAIGSNWDVSLHGVLARLGLDATVDTVVTSAEAGVSKPDRAFFDEVARRLGVRVDELAHIGDDPVLDFDGAVAAGAGAVLVDPDGADARRPNAASVLAALDLLLPA